MGSFVLTAFWIEVADPSGPLGYGVTAFSITDAMEIIRRAGYQLPEQQSMLRVHTDVKPADIEHRYVREHMGPIVIRGLWYPFREVGLGTK